MSITEKMRKVFDACTVMAGVEPDFECVYMTKGAALLYLDEIDAENAKLRERVEKLEELLPENGRWFSTEVVEAYIAEIKKLRELVDYMTPIAWYGASERERDRIRELGVEVDG